MPIYLVVDRLAKPDAEGASRLVSAARPASAVSFVVGDRFLVTNPSPVEMHRLGRAGIDIEDADAEPGQAAEPETSVQQPQDGPQEHDAAPMPEGWKVEPIADEEEAVPAFLRDEDEEVPASRRRSIIDDIEGDTEGALSNADLGIAEDEKPF